MPRPRKLELLPADDKELVAAWQFCEHVRRVVLEDLAGVAKLLDDWQREHRGTAPGLVVRGVREKVRRVA